METTFSNGGVTATTQTPVRFVVAESLMGKVDAADTEVLSYRKVTGTDAGGKVTTTEAQSICIKQTPEVLDKYSDILIRKDEKTGSTFVTVEQFTAVQYPNGDKRASEGLSAILAARGIVPATTTATGLAQRFVTNWALPVEFYGLAPSVLAAIFEDASAYLATRRTVNPARLFEANDVAWLSNLSEDRQDAETAVMTARWANAMPDGTPVTSKATGSRVYSRTVLRFGVDAPDAPHALYLDQVREDEEGGQTLAAAGELV